MTFYERKDDGSVVKVTQRIKVIALRQKTPLRTLERRKNWKPFGKAAAGPEEGATYLSAEEIFMQTPQEDEDEDKNDDFAETVLNAVATANIRTKAGMEAGITPSFGGSKEEGSGSVYKPPKPQGYVAGSSGMPMRGPDEQAPALRVSNISAEATKEDIFQVRA